MLLRVYPKETRTYDRYHFKEQEFWKGKEIEPSIYQIDTHGSFQQQENPIIPPVNLPTEIAVIDGPPRPPEKKINS